MVINHKLEDVTVTFSGTAWEQKLQKGSPFKLIENVEIARRTLPAMIKRAAILAEAAAVSLREAAHKEMSHLLSHELERLQALSQVNDAVRPEEIRLARGHQAELAAVIEQSRLRLDSLRLIWKGPPAALG